MYLLLSILLSAALGYILLLTGPLAGGIIAFGIIVGSLFRGLYLLNKINKRINKISPEHIEKQELEQFQLHVPEHLKNVRAYKKYAAEKERTKLDNQVP